MDSSGSSVIDETIRTEPADAVEAFANPQIPLGYRNHLADGAGQGSRSCISMNHRSTNGRSDLDMRQVKRSVKDIEGPIAKFVVSELSLF